jgi:mannose-1-phosphate guanylyltransferase/mannose-6-phosphate isomerase
MKQAITPVILSGGAGSRLWPLSTAARPKQFHALAGPKTMFAETLARVAVEGGLFGPPMVVCGAAHRAHVEAELAAAGVADATIVLEPVARNTAPALAVAALAQAARDPLALMLVLPADHVIARPQALIEACARARAVAEAGRIVTFAVTPTRPETGYGYIKSGPALGEGLFEVAAFREKPDLAAAEAYLAAGDHAWNAGIFFFQAQAFLEQLARHAPAVLAAARRAFEGATRTGGALALDADAFSAAPAISVDYAIMEPTDMAAVAPVDMGWSDVGSFATLWELAQKDAAGNALDADARAFDSADCLVRSGGLKVALIGVRDLMVIATPEGLLVAPRDRAQDVRLANDAFKT